MTQISNNSEIKNAVDNLAIAYMANAVIKSRISVEEAANNLAEELGIEQSDISLRARALREYLGCIVNCFYDDIEDWNSIDEKEQDARANVMDAMNDYTHACYELYDTYGDASFMYQWAMLAGDVKHAEYYAAEMAA